MNQIVLFLKKNLIIIIGIITGAIGGFLYWKFVGCTSGQCPITGSPVTSTLYGALMGGLLFSLGKSSQKKQTDTSGRNN